MDDEQREHIRNLMSACIRCGGCDRVCPSFNHGGCSPFTIMGGGESDVAKCIGCGKCSENCPVTDPKSVMMLKKAVILDLHPPERFRSCGYITTPCDPEFSDGIPDIEGGDDVYVMPGCVAKHRVPYVVYAAMRSLGYIGIGASELPNNTCCTYPLVFRQEPASSNEAVKKALSDNAGGRETITLCGGCTHELSASGIDFPHICTYYARFTDRIRKLPGAGLKVSVEPGCAVECFGREFREVVEACECTITNRTTGCCGKGIPGVNEALMKEREAESSGADAIVLGCPNCLTAYDKYDGGIPALHISELVCLAAGDSFTQRYHRIKLKRN